MKKVISIFLTLLLTCLLCACGEMTMEQYVEDNKAVFETICESQSNDDCTVEILGKDNSLVLKAVMQMEIEDNLLDAVVDTLKLSTEENKDVYIEMLENAREEVPSAESIIIEYYDINEKLIYSEEFK